jgi:hypothetical protein
MPYVNNAVTFQVMFVEIATSEGAYIFYLIYFKLYLIGVTVYDDNL